MKRGIDVGALVLIGRLALACVMAVAGIAKLGSQGEVRETLAGFGVPQALVKPAGVALAAAELIVAALLVPAATATAAAAAAAALLAVFCVAIGVAIGRGRRPDCNCFGRVHSRPVGWRTIVRNVVLLLVALGVATGGPGESIGRALHGVDAVAAAGVILAVLVLAVQAWFTFQLLRQNGRLLARIRALEDAQRPSAGHRLIQLASDERAAREGAGVAGRVG